MGAIVPEDRPVCTAPVACFHCGLPVEAGTRFGVRVDGRWWAVCCPGCEAVAGTILGQGLEDYYRLRDTVPGRQAEQAISADLALYDDPDIQRAFVHEGEGWREATLMLEGIRCPACVWLNEKAIEAVPGVVKVDANFATQRVRVRWDGTAALSAILAAVSRVGYRAAPHSMAEVERARRDQRRDALWRLFVAAFGMMQVMMYAIPAYLAPAGDMSFDASQLMRWASFVLTVPVVAYSAAPFFTGAWRSLAGGTLGMDVPVALGIAVAFGASLAATLAGSGDVYYDSVTMFVFLLLAGRYLEMLARQRAARSLDHLERAVPEFANRLSDFPRTLASQRVAAASLRRGDLVLVKPGEPLPADGVVVQGSGEVNEALLTGESHPLAKAAGDRVIGGSINVSDVLVVRAEKVGPDTVLSSIRRLVERAAAEKPRFLALADRAAPLFVLVVIALAFVAGYIWLQVEPSRALPVAVAVLVATCPCAFSLATPAAQAVAAGELARLGVVATRGHAIEALARTTDVVFDKTGTLTHGEPVVTDVVPLAALPRERLLAIAAAMEAASEHPIARALVEAAQAAGASTGLPVAEVRSVAGSGVEAMVDGRRYWLGSARFGRGPVGALPATLAGAPGTLVWLSSDEGRLGVFRLKDAARPEAAATLAALRGAGMKVHLLSGDASPAVEELGAQLGIDSVRGEASPEHKREFVRELQRHGARVLMVGDGVNDAPVLAQADVSLAMGNGARIAQAESDAVVVSSNLAALPAALAYARRTLRVVRENVVWAFAYNLTVLPLAMAGELSPWAAAIGMSVSSLAVLLNALRLQRPGRKP